MAVGSSQLDGHLPSSGQCGRTGTAQFSTAEWNSLFSLSLSHPRHSDWSTHSHRPAIASLLSIDETHHHPTDTVCINGSTRIANERRLELFNRKAGIAFRGSRHEVRRARVSE